MFVHLNFSTIQLLNFSTIQLLNKTMETSFDPISISSSTIGRSLSFHDFCDGSLVKITISSLDFLSDGVMFYGSGFRAEASKVFVPNACIASLILTGEAERHSTVCHHDVVCRYHLD